MNSQVLASCLCTGLRVVPDGEKFSDAINMLHDKAVEDAVVERVQAEEECSSPTAPAVWAQAEVYVQLSRMSPNMRRSGLPLLVRCCLPPTAAPQAWPRREFAGDARWHKAVTQEQR